MSPKIAPLPPPATASEESKMLADVAKINSLTIRFNKFKAILDLPNIDLGTKLFLNLKNYNFAGLKICFCIKEQLKKLSWPGIPEEIRPTVWKLLMVPHFTLQSVTNNIFFLAKFFLYKRATCR